MKREGESEGKGEKEKERRRERENKYIINVCQIRWNRPPEVSCWTNSSCHLKQGFPDFAKIHPYQMTCLAQPVVTLPVLTLLRRHGNGGERFSNSRCKLLATWGASGRINSVGFNGSLFFIFTSRENAMVCLSWHQRRTTYSVTVQLSETEKLIDRIRVVDLKDNFPILNAS